MYGIPAEMIIKKACTVIFSPEMSFPYHEQKNLQRYPT